MNDPFLAHSEITNEIYIICGKKKYCVTEQVISAMKATGRLNERPQGEWLTHRVAFHLTCPFCGCNLRALKDEVFEGDYEYNFCPNCGTDMRGGRE